MGSAAALCLGTEMSLAVVLHAKLRSGKRFEGEIQSVLGALGPSRALLAAIVMSHLLFRLRVPSLLPFPLTALLYGLGSPRLSFQPCQEHHLKQSTSPRPVLCGNPSVPSHPPPISTTSRPPRAVLAPLSTGDLLGPPLSAKLGGSSVQELKRT
jgi:hypothetical protein